MPTKPLRIWGGQGVFKSIMQEENIMVTWVKALGTPAGWPCLYADETEPVKCLLLLRLPEQIAYSSRWFLNLLLYDKRHREIAVSTG